MASTNIIEFPIITRRMVQELVDFEFRYNWKVNNLRVKYLSNHSNYLILKNISTTQYWSIRENVTHSTRNHHSVKDILLHRPKSNNIWLGNLQIILVMRKGQEHWKHEIFYEVNRALCKSMSTMDWDLYTVDEDLDPKTLWQSILNVKKPGKLYQ